MIEILLLAAALQRPAIDAIVPPPRLRVEPHLSYSVTHYSNLFQERSEAGIVADTEQTLVAGTGLTWQRAPQRAIRLDGELSLHRFTDHPSSSYPQLVLGISHLGASTAIALTAGFAGERLLFVTFRDQEVLHTDREVGVSIEQSLGRGLALEVAIDNTREDYVAGFDERDSSTIAFATKLKLPYWHQVSPRLGFQLERETADSTNYSQNERAVTLELAMRPHARLSLFARLRLKDKSYLAVPAERNFGREDDVRDLLIEGRLRVRGPFSLMAQASDRHGKSTRADRNFTAREVRVEATFKR